MNTCQYTLLDGHYCDAPCEGKTIYCATHGRIIRKAATDAAKAIEKRKALLSKPKNIYKAPNKVSDKRKIENEEYKRLRDEFLFENPDCQIKANQYCSKVATTIHHTAGRVGDNFLDITKWKGACMSCHQFLHDHPKEAIDRGWSQSRLAKTEPHKI